MPEMDSPSPEQNPTPLPWSVGHDGPSRPIIFGGDGTWLTIGRLVYTRAEPYEHEEADAAFIVEAVNGYAALQERLEAAEAALRSIDIEYCSPCGGTGERWNPIRGLFDGQCSYCSGTGQIAVLTPLLARAEAAERLNGELVAALWAIIHAEDALDNQRIGMAVESASDLLARIEAESSPKDEAVQ